MRSAKRYLLLRDPTALYGVWLWFRGCVVLGGCLYGCVRVIVAVWLWLCGRGCVIMWLFVCGSLVVVSWSCGCDCVVVWLRVCGSVVVIVWVWLHGCGFWFDEST